ncbi:MAG: lytic transglycosylase domain-containing protein [Bacteroidota bacterium]
MKKQKLWRINIALLSLSCVFIFMASRLGTTADEAKNFSNTDNIPQIVKGMDLERSFSFCEERVPTDNFDVRERLDRELTVNTYWHSSTILSIKAKMRYFPTMDRILEEEGVPTDLKYVAVAESALRHVTSPAGAKGFWQFMRGTAQEYGLEVNDEVDERYHLEKSTRAAAKYLKSLHNRFGSWANAAAAYNMGGGNMNKRLREQEAENYFELNLNEETSRYYFRLVAIKYIMENPRAYGFYLDEKDYYPPLDNFKELSVNEAISSWGAFAKENGTTYRMLKVYNPWLVSNKLTNRNKKTYTIRLARQ